MFLVPWFKWNEIKQLLQGLSTSLRHLTLNIRTTENVLNGQEWEEFLINFSCLRTFNVFFFSSYHADWTEILNGYRSTFWCKQKKWYFIGIGYILCSLSCYNSDLPLSNFRLPDHTAPNNDWFYSYSVINFDAHYLTETFVNYRQVPKRLFHGREMQLKGNFQHFYASSIIQLIAERVDLSCIRKFQSNDSILAERFLLVFQTEIPCLTELDIRITSDAKTFKRFPRFERIQRIQYSSELPTKCTRDFTRIFPNVEHLIINIQSHNQIFQLTHELIRLQSIHFHQYFECKSITRDELIKRTRFQNHSSTMNDSFSHLTCWISHSSTDCQLVEPSPISRYNRIRRCSECFLFILFCLVSNLFYFFLL